MQGQYNLIPLLCFPSQKSCCTSLPALLIFAVAFVPFAQRKNPFWKILYHGCAPGCARRLALTNGDDFLASN